MLPITEAAVQEWSDIGPKGAFGKAIIAVAEACPDVVVVTADLSDATRVTEYSRLFPDRFFQVGIAEQNLIGVAAGLALHGKIPFATTFAAFASMRCCEQVRTDVAYPDCNVKVLGADGGVVMGTLGTTHYGIEDIAIMRAIPNMTVLSPCDGAEVVKATAAAALHVGPVYLRLTGGKKMPIVYREDFSFEIGKAITLRPGDDATILATGTMVAKALGAADLLEARGLNVRVVDMHTIKPLDEDAVRSAAQETSLIVTAEEHTVIGGLGSAVAEIVSGLQDTPRLVRIGLPDRFGHIANYAGLLNGYGLTEPGIADAVERNLPEPAAERPRDLALSAL
ncbi:MAG: transketolase [Kiritimatiellae bacterium]|nr:transketolase [Kiritimatiellia bacterium]